MQVSSRGCPHSAHLRQATCHSRSGDTRSRKGSWMRPPQPAHRASPGRPAGSECDTVRGSDVQEQKRQELGKTTFKKKTFFPFYFFFFLQNRKKEEIKTETWREGKDGNTKGEK